MGFPVALLGLHAPDWEYEQERKDQKADISS